ncbi:FxSxx-COOH system tetratricopeptide repeat protein [Streptomyces sp. NPDC001816]|uniref:FxSxx-COOH system tetratricopeptide repeat protein n=1 Tax=Streptomyces sp. NPDC001816 TaxID=3364612 RepID=UPI0036991867
MTNYASATVPEWAAHAWVVWPAFGVLVAASVGLLLWGRRLDGGSPSVRLTSLDRLAGARHGSLRRPYVERMRGRDTESAVLMRMLRRPQGRFAVVCGAGGLGKTTLAAQLATQAEKDGWAVYWLRYRNAVELTQQLTQVAVARGLPEAALEAARAGQESLPDVVWRQLESSRRWLVVLDNVDDAQAVGPGDEPLAHYRGWIRPRGGGLLLVTSRDASEQTWGTRAELLRLQPLAVPDAGQVLLDAAPQAGTQQQAQELASRLGGLPLALHAVGSYLATATSRYRSFDQYRRALDAELPTLLGAQHSNATDPDVARTVVRHTWEVSLDQLTAEGNTLARPLLRMLSLMPQAPIPLSLITPSLLADVTGEVVTVVAVEAALAGLHRYGLLGVIEPAAEDEVTQEDIAQVVLHPLIREISSLALRAETTDLAYWHRVLTDRLTEAAHDVASVGRPGWPAARLLAPHLRVLIDHSTSETLIEDVATVDALTEVLHDAGAYTLQCALDQQVVAVHIRLLGPEHPRTLASCNDLTRVLREVGEYAQSVHLGRRTLDDCTRILGPEHPHTLDSRNNLAAALRDMGENAQATDLWQRTLDDRTRILGPEHPDTVISRNNLAVALDRMGDHEQAADLWRRGIDDCTRILGPEHPETLIIQNNLANALHHMGEHEQAVDLHQRTLDDRMRVLGPEHPHTLISQNNLANALRDMGEYAQAADLHRRALDGYTRSLGPEHPHTLNCRDNLANALDRMGEHERAADLWRRTLDDRMRVLGPEHPDTLDSRNGLAVALHNMGEYAQAADLHRRTLEDRTRILGPEHPGTLHSRSNLQQSLIASRSARRRLDRRLRRWTHR